jgi:hypothetical protein
MGKILAITKKGRIACHEINSLTGDDIDLIYVDKTANGANTGVSWADAYTDLADAIARATESVCVDNFTIYVAQGTYKPNNTPGESFAFPYLFEGKFTI